MQDGSKAVWSIPYVSVTFSPSLKQNFIAYRSSKVSWRPDCIFEIHQLWQSGFSRVYSNCCCSCSFELEIIKTSQPSHKINSNSIMNFQESRTILNTCTKKDWKSIECTTYLKQHLRTRLMRKSTKELTEELLDVTPLWLLFKKYRKRSGWYEICWNEETKMIIWLGIMQRSVKKQTLECRRSNHT